MTSVDTRSGVMSLGDIISGGTASGGMALGDIASGNAFSVHWAGIDLDDIQIDVATPSNTITWDGIDLKDI